MHFEKSTLIFKCQLLLRSRFTSKYLVLSDSKQTALFRRPYSFLHTFTFDSIQDRDSWVQTCHDTQNEMKKVFYCKGVQKMKFPLRRTNICFKSMMILYKNIKLYFQLIS
jgi:hypothetical protein